MRIIAFAPNDWNGPWMNRQQLLTRLGRRHNIIYSNGLWDIWQRHDVRFKETAFCGSFLTQDNVSIDHPPKYLLHWPTLALWDNFVILLGSLRLRRRFRRDASGPLVVYTFHPGYLPYIKKIKPDFLIYHAYDLFRLTPGWDQTLQEQEKFLLRHADYIFGSSQTIVDELQKESPENKNIIFLPNGADFELFSNTAHTAVANKEPEDLASIPHPRIGYTGNINRKVDLPLIKELAGKNQQWNFVFIGNVANLDDLTIKGFEECCALKNVHLLGHKPHRELPHYINNMDVNIMPYRIDDKIWAQAGYPLKLHEYLATGKPIVSTNIPAVREFSHVLLLVDNIGKHDKGDNMEKYADRWQKALSTALNDNQPENNALRIKVAEQNSWDERVKSINDYISQLG